MALDLLLEQFDGLIQTSADVKKIEQSILQWAIMGRLVRQEPNDEPAAVLLKRIAAERARLVREKKIKRAKKLPPSSPQELPFELPKGWVVCRLDEITIKVGAGSTPKGGKKVYTARGVKFLRSQNIWNNGLQLDGVAHIPDEINQRMFKTIVRPKDILLNITGASIGRSTLVPDEFDLANVSQHVAIVRPIEPQTRFFIHLCLISPYIQRTIMDVQVGISREGLSITQLKKFVLPMPPLEEQKRIVAQVNQLFEQTGTLAAQLEAAHEARRRLQRATVGQLVSANSISPPPAPPNADSEQIRALLMGEFDRLHSQRADVDALKQTILQLAVMGRLVPQEPKDEPASVLLKRIAAERARLVKEKKIKRSKKSPFISKDKVPFELPQKWAWVCLGNLGITQTGTTPSTKKPEFFGNEFPFIKPADLRPDRINYENQGLSKQGIEVGRLIAADSVLMVCIGDSIGKTGLVDRDCSCNQQINALTPSSHLATRYLFFALRSPYFQNEVISRASKATLPILSKGKWQQIPLPLPPLEEQKRIVARVEQLLARSDQLTAQLQSAEAMRERLLDAVLAQAVRGN